MTDRLAQLQKLHAADPADPFVTYGIAMEHAKTHQLDEALAWLDRTLSLDEHYCYAYFQKGKVLSALGREAEAAAVLRTGIDKARAAGDAHAASEIAALLESL